ncbi:hypothetical protein [Escherichia coli]|uniref:hypothetical protein n=1 Tax=Escherichia coli TaxID=562 RepID=UPI000BE18EC9|nr:hypothetical protein [Escherichia coli]HDQ6782355.1 hypothetical protein [Escherichia coli O113:H4]
MNHGGLLKVNHGGSIEVNAMAIQITQLHQADIFGYIADMLETARLLSSLEKGEQLAFELIYFAQQAAREAANKPWDE